MIIYYILFFLGLFIIIYNYVGYGILLWCSVKIKRLFSPAPREDASHEPTVSLVVAAYNEAGILHAKIRNTLELDYPADKLQVIFITDGSTDESPAILSSCPRILGMHLPERNGKTAALNRAITAATGDVLIFCDANTFLNRAAVREIVKHYADPATGGVAGEKRVITAGEVNNAAATEGIYWKYESLLKKWDAELYSVVGAAGELFSVRKELYETVPANVVLDDFVISLRVNLKGYRVAYAPGAYAMESPSDNITEEHKRKVRICAGAFQAMGMLGGLWKFWKFPLLTFQYVSHRVLRWTITPLSLIVLLVSNIVIVWQDDHWFYRLVLLAQGAFYLLATVGYFLAQRKVKSTLFYIPYYFLFMNIAVFQGFARFMKKSQPASWERSKRQETDLVMNEAISTKN